MMTPFAASSPASPRHLFKALLKAIEKMAGNRGNAPGVDRRVMLFADTAGIEDVVAFTQEELSSKSEHLQYGCNFYRHGLLQI